MIKNFIERNKSIFAIGFVTFVIFMAIIVISEVRRLKGAGENPILIKVEESTESAGSEGITTFEEVYLVGEAEDVPVESSGSSPEDEMYKELDRKYKTMRIEYNTNGFVPTNAKAILGQKVKWVNNTNWEMKIRQKAAFFKEFETPVVIPAGGEYTFRLTKEGMWSYEEVVSKSFGSIIILKP